MGARTGAHGVGGCRVKETQKRGEEEGELNTVATVEVL